MEESDGRDSSVLRRLIVIMSVNNTMNHSCDYAYDFSTSTYAHSNNSVSLNCKVSIISGKLSYVDPLPVPSVQVPGVERV